MKDIHGSEDWRSLCELASKEQDPERLLDLISKINRALEECSRQSRMQRAPIKIKHVVLPAKMFDESEMELPGAYFQQLPIEYDC